jgi:hypothetical protein
MADEAKIRWNDLSDEDKDAALATNPDEARFWTGVGTDNEEGEDVARGLAEKDGGQTLEMKLDAANIDRDSLEEQAPTTDSNGNTRNGWSEASEKFAEGSSGDVKCYEGDSPRKESTFNNTEAPALNDNAKVNSITKEDALGEEKENGKYTRNNDGDLENTNGDKLTPNQEQSIEKPVEGSGQTTQPQPSDQSGDINSTVKPAADNFPSEQNKGETADNSPSKTEHDTSSAGGYKPSDDISSTVSPSQETASPSVGDASPDVSPSP